MKLDFKFSNLCGTVYKQGNLVFTPDGNSILSPVGNRISVFDLVNNKSLTLPFENRKNISRIALSPNGILLLSIDEDGRAILCNFVRRIILHRFNFKKKVLDVKFSPDGQYIAVTHGNQVQVWKTPTYEREFAPFELHRTYTGHYDDVISITWSPDSQYFLTTSKDMTAKMYSLHSLEDFIPITLSGHRDTVIAAFFSSDQQTIYTVSKDGGMFIWKDPDSEEIKNNEDLPEDMQQALKRTRMDIEASNRKRKYRRWWVTQREYFNQGKVQCATFHLQNNLLVVGFNSGIFGLYELPDFNNIHTLSISQNKIDFVALNNTGEWIAFGSSKLGQLLIWEWQSETYVLKQQGHYYDTNTLSYSSDGKYIATGGDDGKVKIWSTVTGFCFVTFNEHSSGVSAVQFAKNGQVVFSASLDGTVRAFDLIRYRNFRTFTSPTPVQFNCLAVDPSGEIVCAGSLDTFEIYVWSVQTGKLLDILSGHEGPVSSLAFNTSGNMLVSGSWDKTVRTWDVFGRGRFTETFNHNSDVLAVAYRPDGQEICATTLDGQISFWNPNDGKMMGTIEGRDDLGAGRKATDRMTAKNSAYGKAFNSVCYTADGENILAGGNSKYVCLYSTVQKILLTRFELSNNLSYDGMLEMLNSKNMTEAGPLDLIDDESEEESDLEDRLDKSLPGASTMDKKGDPSLRRTRPTFRTKDVKFSPTGQAWAAATTEGLIIYSLDQAILFDPFDLEIDITPETIQEALDNEEYLKALVMSFRLGDHSISVKIYNSIPSRDIELISKNFPLKYLDRMFRLVVTMLEQSKCIQFSMMWGCSLLKYHAKYMKQNSNDFMTIFRGLYKSMVKHYEDLGQVCNSNTYKMKYLMKKGQQKMNKKQSDSMDIENIEF